MAWDDFRWTVCYVDKFSGGSTLQAAHVVGPTCSEREQTAPVRLEAIKRKCGDVLVAHCRLHMTP